MNLLPALVVSRDCGLAGLSCRRLPERVLAIAGLALGQAADPVGQDTPLAGTERSCSSVSGPMSLDQLRKAGLRNRLQNLRQHGIVVAYGVAPVSHPDRRKRPECQT